MAVNLLRVMVNVLLPVNRQKMCSLHFFQCLYQFKEDMVQWQNKSPKADDILHIKKSIRSLRSQLRWKLVEVGCLEEVYSLFTCLSVVLGLL